ncbi:uncharacterized protein LOC118465390 [Anopheles albimanus]|uniref:uncharacterized protein LOC118465390 n=1 Tax=Anopheles albimanus TaxID=7167 RepID=UPI0016404E0B|nr:uncharacterized protein LOC118465390 [Anopheles albimanus]
MGLTVKFVLPLIGAIMLCGFVTATRRGYDDVNSLPPEEKRRIIRELLRAQKDIRKALLKIHFHLDGEEIEEDDDDDYRMKFCWDKELVQYRKSFEKKLAALSRGLKHANEMLDEIEHYGHGGPHGGHHGSGYGGHRPEKPEGGHKPNKPDSHEHEDEDEDEYYNRRLKTGGNRRYGRQVQLEENPVQEQEAINPEHEPSGAIESDVEEAIEQLAPDTE